MIRFAVLFFALTLICGAQPASFMQRDGDGNGRLTRAESRLAPALFQKLDESGNGELSLGEFDEYWKTVVEPPVLADAHYGLEAEQTLDLYLPEDTKGPVPLVLWIHGGSWQHGSKRGCPFQTFTKEGFAVAALDYRLAPAHRFPTQMEDCQKALALAKSEMGRRGFRIGEVTAVGLSAGGHLSGLLCATGSVERAVTFGAPVDLTDVAGQEKFRDTLEALVGRPLEANARTLAEASPAFRLSEQSGRFLIFHGLEDRLIPYTQSLLMAKKVAGVKAAVSVILVPDGSHTIVGGPAGWRQMVEFIEGP